MLKILSDLGPGKVKGTTSVGVKSCNPSRTTCQEEAKIKYFFFWVNGESLFQIIKGFRKRRLTRTDPTVRDES